MIGMDGRQVVGCVDFYVGTKPSVGICTARIAASEKVLDSMDRSGYLPRRRQ
jgi:hypothetical protein